MIKDVEHFFKCYSVIRDSSVVNFVYLCIQFFTCLFCLLVSKYLSFYLYILNISPLLDVGLAKIFSHSVGY
jgi:maltodextrin utilization protein YvdJ